MTDKQNSVECNVVCWGIAAFVGFVSMVMLYMLADFGALQAIFTGGLIGVLLGVVLSVFVCRGQTAAADLAADEKPAQRYAREAAEDAEARGVAAPAAGRGASGTAAAPAAAGTASGTAGTGDGTASGAADAASSDTGGAAASASGGAAPAAASATAAPLMGSVVKPSKPLAGEAELAGRKGEWKYEGNGGANTAAKSAAAEKPAAANTAAAAAPAATADADGSKAKRAPVAADGKPELYDAPPADGADDLKLISGVGPKLEGTLNEMGIYRFEQVAAWRKKEIEWVDARLRFKGRIVRDDWMSQAKILAKGGETEFSRKKK